MRRKKLCALLCAAALALSAVGGVPVSAEPGGETALSEETGGTLSAPTNVREENGFIKWDEVPNAYGYTVRTQIDDKEFSQTYYESEAEWKRFLYEQNRIHSFNPAFGEYSFQISAFDELGKSSGWSEAVTTSFTASFDAAITLFQSPDNEDVIGWNAVDNEANYNVTINNEDGSLYKNISSWCSFSDANNHYMSISDVISETGTYKIRVQIVDKNYNFSSWSEPFTITYTVPVIKAPQNVRLDESGDYVVWDAVEGATKYTIKVDSSGMSNFTSVEAPLCQSKWKFAASPFSDGKYLITVTSYAGSKRGDSSDPIKVDFTPVLDETLAIPDDIQYSNNALGWEQKDGEDAGLRWLRVSAYGNYFSDGGECGTVAGVVCIFPRGTYTVDRALNGENGTYNTRTDTFTITNPPDESVWIPEPYCKFNSVMWEWDRVKHSETFNFWLRLSKEDGTVVDLERINYLNSFSFGAIENEVWYEDGDYIVEVCADSSVAGNVGEWSEPLRITLYNGNLFNENNKTTSSVESAPDSEKIPEPDRITSITINPAFNMKNKNGTNVELDLTKIKIKAQEIYDEEGLKRAEEALGEEIIGNKHYNLLDLTLLYDDQDFSNGYEGLVQVIIPIPTGHRDKTFSCYRLIEVDGKTTKEIIPGKQTEDGYIIYLEHFSDYALVADGGEETHTHTFPTEWKTGSSSHWYECACGEKSELAAHIENSGVITTAPTTEATGVKTYSCTVCGYIMRTETVDKLEPDHTHTFPTEWKSDSSSHWYECACGEKSELAAHIENSGVITTEPTTEATGVKTYSCTVCGYTMRTETVDKLEPAKQGFYSVGVSITDAPLGTIVTQKTAAKDGKQDVRFIQKVNGGDLSGKSKATFTLTSSETGKTPQKVSTDKYYTGLTYDDGTKVTAASGQVFLCYTVKDVPEGVTVEATAVELE